jgi:hypothetical protein
MAQEMAHAVGRESAAPFTGRPEVMVEFVRQSEEEFSSEKRRYISRQKIISQQAACQLEVASRNKTEHHIIPSLQYANHAGRTQSMRAEYLLQNVWFTARSLKNKMSN